MSSKAKSISWDSPFKWRQSLHTICYLRSCPCCRWRWPHLPSALSPPAAQWAAPHRCWSAGWRGSPGRSPTCAAQSGTRTPRWACSRRAASAHRRVCRQGAAALHERNREQYNNQCCGSEMFTPDPDYYPSRISDPTTAPKEEVGKI